MLRLSKVLRSEENGCFERTGRRTLTSRKQDTRPFWPRHCDPNRTIFLAQVCTQVLEVPSGVEISHVTVSAGHPSSSSIYPACFAPYVITTACSDGCVRFWKCRTSQVWQVPRKHTHGHTH